MTHLIERVLSLRPGDLRRGLPLFAYLFLILASYVVGRVVRDSLFLSRFPATQLPYVDIVTAVAVAVVVAIYIRLCRGRSIRTLLLATTIVCALNCVVFWALARYYEPRWLYPTVYAWVGVFGVLATTQVWALANQVLTTREARRVFGLVASGAISGGIFGGFFSKVVAKSFGAESLLLGMAVFIAVCPLLVVVICRQHESIAGSESLPCGEQPQQNLLNSMRVVFSSPYLRSIATLIWVSSFVTAVIGWQFKATAKQFIPAKDHLAAFFGDFTFYAGILALIVQLLLTSRLLRRFGVGLVMFILPLMLLASSAYMLVAGTLFAAVLLRGSDWVWRYSTDKSSVELLYLPMPARVKFQVKWFIDTVIWRTGDGIAGLTVLFFAGYLKFTARQMSWVGLVLAAGWIVAVWVARGQYVATIAQSMKEHRVETDRAIAPVLDRSTTDVLAASLSASDPKEVLYALGIFESGQKQAAHPAIRDLLNHPAHEVRKKAIEILSAAGDKVVLPTIETLLQDPSLEVRTEALLYLAHYAHVDPLERIQQLGDFADFSIRSAMTAFLARPGESQNLDAARQLLSTMVAEPGPDGAQTRVEAARLLGILPDEFGELLSQLLRDSEVEVVRESIQSIGKLRKRRLVPELLDRLCDRRFAADIGDALSCFGGTILGQLRDHMSDAAIPIATRREVPNLVARVGTQEASYALMELLLDSDTNLRYRVLAALITLHRGHPELKCDAQLLETALTAEILGHYRSYQIVKQLRAVVADNTEDEVVTRALSESMKQEIERIFRLLELLSPHHDFASAYIGLQSKSMTVHDNALEFLDAVLKKQLREMLVPLLDGKVSALERATMADRYVPIKITSSVEAASALVASDDPWLRSCGAYAIGNLNLHTLVPELNRCAADQDALVRETARQAKMRLQQGKAASTA